MAMMMIGFVSRYSLCLSSIYTLLLEGDSNFITVGKFFFDGELSKNIEYSRQIKAKTIFCFSA